MRACDAVSCGSVAVISGAPTVIRNMLIPAGRK